jgi:hypothetical protein
MAFARHPERQRAGALPAVDDFAGRGVLRLPLPASLSLFQCACRNPYGPAHLVEPLDPNTSAFRPGLANNDGGFKVVSQPNHSWDCVRWLRNLCFVQILLCL